MLSKNLSRGSRLAYDFKIRGIADEFGRGGHTERPFRLGSEIREVDSFHEGLGYHVRDLEWSAELAKKLLGSEESWAGPLFAEDALVKLEVK